MSVTGVDRLEKVLAIARMEVTDEDVEFRTADLKTLEYQPHSCDAIMIIETLGLMSNEDDAELIRKAAAWLKPGAKLLVDFPKESEDPDGQNTAMTPEGLLTVTYSYEPTTRLQSIVPVLDRGRGNTIELMDPYDPGRGSVEGLVRYIYAFDEMSSLLDGLGLIPEQVEHFLSPNHHCIIARKDRGAVL